MALEGALFPQHPPTHSVLQTALVTAAADFSYPMPDFYFNQVISFISLPFLLHNSSLLAF